MEFKTKLLSGAHDAEKGASIPSPLSAVPASDSTRPIGATTIRAIRSFRSPLTASVPRLISRPGSTSRRCALKAWRPKSPSKPCETVLTTGKPATDCHRRTACANQEHREERMRSFARNFGIGTLVVAAAAVFALSSAQAEPLKLRLSVESTPGAAT